MRYLRRFFSSDDKPEIKLTYDEYIHIGKKIESLLEIELEELNNIELVKFNSTEYAAKDPVSKEFKFWYAINLSIDDFELEEEVKKKVLKFKTKYGFSNVYFPHNSNDDEVIAVYLILFHLNPATLI